MKLAYVMKCSTDYKIWCMKALTLQGIDGKKNNDSNFQLSLERIPEPPYFEKSIVEFLSFLIIFWQLFTLPCVLHAVTNITSEKHSGIKVAFFPVFVINFILAFNSNFPKIFVKFIFVIYRISLRIISIHFPCLKDRELEYFFLL